VAGEFILRLRCPEHAGTRQSQRLDFLDGGCSGKRWARSHFARRYKKKMANIDIQIVSGESGEPTAVIVPIELWREIES